MENKSVGKEIMRVLDTDSTDVKRIKEKYAEVFDLMTDFAINAQKKMDDTPKIHSAESISRHMEVIRTGEELMRCMSEAGRFLEMACMWTVKGVTS